MRKYWIGFTSGISCVAICLSLYAGHLLKVASPGIISSIEPQTFSKQEKAEMVSALIKLSDLSNIIGLDRYSSLFIGSAGLIGLDTGITPKESEYKILKSIRLAKNYGVTNGDYDPYFEAIFTAGMFYKDIDDKQSAREIIQNGLTLAKFEKSKSYWLRNLEKLNRTL